MVVQGVRIALTDGAFHAVDSSELAFKLASVYAFRAAYAQAAPTVLEPVMMVEVTVPGESQVCGVAGNPGGGRLRIVSRLHGSAPTYCVSRSEAARHVRARCCAVAVCRRRRECGTAVQLSFGARQPSSILNSCIRRAISAAAARGCGFCAHVLAGVQTWATYRFVTTTSESDGADCRAR